MWLPQWSHHQIMLKNLQSHLEIKRISLFLSKGNVIDGFNSTTEITSNKEAVIGSLSNIH